MMRVSSSEISQPIESWDIETLLDEYVHACNQYSDYVDRVDSVDWSASKQHSAWSWMHRLKCEILKRCGADIDMRKQK